MNTFSFKKVNNTEQGQALVLLLVTIYVLCSISAAFAMRVIQEKNLVERKRLDLETFFLNEGAIEDTISAFKSDIANFQVSATTSTYPATGTHTTTYSATSSIPNGATVSTIVSEAEANQRNVTDPDGISVFEKNYQVASTITHPENTTFTSTLNRIITRRLIYAFQHAVFYEDNLEIFPGPNMTFSGRIHSNSDIYLGANNTLTVDSEYLRSTGKIYNERKDNGSVPPGNVSIKEAGTTDYYDMAGLDSNQSNWASESQSRWGGTVQSDVHGVTELAIPSVGTIEPDGYYNTNAINGGLEIKNGTLYKNGTALSEGADIPVGTITTTTSFYNNREGKTIKMTEIDLEKLGGGSFDSKTYSNQLEASNGLIYATRTDEGSNQGGVRLKNGSEIKRTDGLTVVTNEPLYIQGDYNIIDKKPTAVITDAVNILSNNWNDSNSTLGVDSRVASDTSVNTAFIAGIDTTSTGSYNGGLENYPRMHEKWSSKDLNIRGSFIALWNSRVATGAWHYGDPQYKAPNRNWDYDTDFANGDMPPFTPWAVDIQKGAWWKS